MCESHICAWDCATGNGQAAASLVSYFDKVIGTDASKEQLASADASSGVEYRVARAEDSGLDADSVDLVTVAQALHWFDIEAFFAEAKRVLKPGGVLAFWCYQNCMVDDAVDPVVLDIFTEVDDFWPPEREIVEEAYPTIKIPFAEERVGDYCIEADWRADQLLDYMRTWSAARRYAQAHGRDPIELHADALRSCWGGGTRLVRWPIVLRAGRNRPA